MLDVAARERLPERLSHVWLEAGYTGQDKGAGWVERMLWDGRPRRSCDYPKKPAPEEVMRAIG